MKEQREEGKPLPMRRWFYTTGMPIHLLQVYSEYKRGFHQSHAYQGEGNMPVCKDHLLIHIHKDIFQDLKETPSLWFYFCPLFQLST